MKSFFLWGSIVIAPILQFSYAKIFPIIIPELTKKGALKKLVLDRVFVAPILMLLFYPAINFFEGNSYE